MIIVSKLQPGTRLLIESNVGTIYALKVLDKRLVEVYSTDSAFREGPPKTAEFVGSCHEKSGPRTLDQIRKNCRMLFRFADVYFVSEPVQTALVEGDGWKFEAIT